MMDEIESDKIYPTFLFKIYCNELLTIPLKTLKFPKKRPINQIRKVLRKRKESATMGMAASQARLLTITARLADNELKSQTINNAKMRLAAQSSQASENYINALNNAVLKFTNYDEVGEIMNQALTFNALTAYSSYNTQYGLANSAGQILVSEAEDAIFKSCGNNLNNYLKAHGLEYKTTYFEEAGGFTNVSYPAPFNQISPEELNKYYEEYGSYENSVEVENFQKAYSEYATVSKNLNAAGEYALDLYLLNGNVNTLANTRNGYVLNLTSYSFGDLQTEFRNAFNNDSNKYSLNNLLEKGYISQTLVDELQEDINATSYEVVYNSEINQYEVKGKLSEKSVYELTDETETQVTYKFEEGFSIIVNKVTGNVIGCNTEELSKDAQDSGEEMTINDTNCKTDNTQSLKNFLSKFSYTVTERDENNIITDKVEYKHYMDDNGNVYSYSYYDSVSDFKELLQEDRTDYIMQKILEEFDFDKFLNDLKNNPDTFGIDTSTRVPGANNMTISEIVNQYKTAKEDFLGNIFSQDSLEQVQQDLDDKTRIQMFDGEGNKLLNRKNEDDLRPVTPENLQDIEFLMQYFKQSENVNASTNFETVIKEYIMDQVIETYGTPKYAWLDENDTTNSGNADAKAQWYTNLFTRMQQGYKALEDGLASSKEWIEYALKSGIVSMEQVNKSFKWTSMDYKTCTRITEETDDAAVTKAEAEYNRAMHDIEAKDNIYDLELKNIDTEHTSLQTEYDVIKEVIKKNIDRTMKFNQSA